MTDEVYIREINIIARSLNSTQKTLLLTMRKDPNKSWREIYLRSRVFFNVNERRELWRELERVEQYRDG